MLNLKSCTKLIQPLIYLNTRSNSPVNIRKALNSQSVLKYQNDSPNKNLVNQMIVSKHKRNTKKYNRSDLGVIPSQMQIRGICTSSVRFCEAVQSKRPVPRLIYVRNPITWMVTKFDLGVLRRLWDSEFVEKDFLRGTVQAISTITNIMSSRKFDYLHGLLTSPARNSLLKELNRNWSDDQLDLISLSDQDIQIFVPRKVHFIKMGDKRYCDIDMSFVALKWASSSASDGLVFTEIFSRFHRDYTPHAIPEWTIAYFKVTRFQIIKGDNLNVQKS